MSSLRFENVLRVSDHALVRFLERAGGLDVEGLRAALTGSLARAEVMAKSVGKDRYNILADGLVYVVKSGVVVTILPARSGRDRQAPVPAPEAE